MKKMILFASIIVFLFIIISFFTKLEKNKVENESVNYYSNKISLENLRGNIKDKKDQIIYFYQTDCVHCKAISPIVVPLTKEMKINMKVIDFQNESKSTWDEFKITGTPTIIYYKDGKEEKRIKGVFNKEEYKQWFLKNVK